MAIIGDRRQFETSLRQSEEALRASEARHRTLVEQASDAIFVTDAVGGLAEVNPAACKLLGYGREELLGTTVDDLVPAAPESERHSKLDKLRAGGTVLSERLLPRKDGSLVPVEISARLLPAGQFHGIVRDISARWAAEAERERLAAAVSEAVRQAAAAYRSVFEDNPAPMWVYDRDSLGFLAANDAAVRVYGYSRSEFLEMTISDIRPPDDVGRLHDNVNVNRSEHEISGPWRHRHKDGSMAEVEIASHAIEFEGRAARLVLVTDLTPRRALEAQLRQAQKMEAVGRLAGGVAHDFNNLLSAIRVYAELSLLETEPGDEVHEFIAEILRAADRAKTLTQRLLTFARQQPASNAVVDLSEVLAGLRPMLYQAVDERIKLTVELPAHPVFARLDVALVEQAVLNLAINARDATPASGTIAIMLTRESVDAGHRAAQSGLVPGDYAVVSVVDTGDGISPEHLPLLFEPFFTTKPANKGTGLGLSIVYSVATGAGGTVLVDSTLGAGARFDLLFPVVEASEPVVGPASPPLTDGLSGSEPILVVEDEPAIRVFVSRVLLTRGYTVRSVGSAEEALALADDIPPALLVSDVLLPKMSGPELADALRARVPGLGVLFVSGYEGDRLAPAAGFDPGTAFLAKPFASGELLRAVREVLDTPVLVAAPQAS